MMNKLAHQGTISYLYSAYRVLTWNPDLYLSFLTKYSSSLLRKSTLNAENNVFFVGAAIETALVFLAQGNNLRFSFPPARTISTVLQAKWFSIWKTMTKVGQAEHKQLLSVEKTNAGCRKRFLNDAAIWITLVSVDFLFLFHIFGNTKSK